MNFLKSFGSSASAQDGETTSLLGEWKAYQDPEAGAGGAAASAPSTSSSSGLQQSLDRAKGLFNSSYQAVATKVQSGASAVGAALPNAETFSIPSGQQLVMFFSFLAAGAVFLLLSFMLFLPVIVLVPAKFAVSFTLGCLCVMLGFSALRGFKAQFLHMASLQRLPFSAVYIGSIVATLYVALIQGSYILSLVFSGVQVVAIIFYIMSYFPGGTAGAKFMLTAFANAVAGCFGRLFK